MRVEGMEYLPDNYKFELVKTIRQIGRRGARRVAIQFPEGIMHLSTVISDIIRANTDVSSVFILSDVVYGACCIDDISAFLIDCDLLIHYGHSCLFEITKSLIQVLYVFVEISFDISHCLRLVEENIRTDSLSVLGTIQYNSTVRKIKREIEKKMLFISDGKNRTEIPSVSVPRVLPLSQGEVLGCTSPTVVTDTVLFVSEGRFHLESLMIQNPGKTYFRYCPSSKVLSLEEHDFEKFLQIRKNIKNNRKKEGEYLVIFGTLGRQGSAGILQRILEDMKNRRRKFFVVFLSEIDEVFLRDLKDTTVVEIACPRIAIDWGSTFDIPIITPFEYFSEDISSYKMDYYAREEDRKPWQSF